ncbi:MAG: hypothetical protein B7Y48_07640 [Methylophilales bacterium 28-44-11]|nr:MAG: hypothetical protein B7Y48_07640 [Methylophilales bacterium 28-44-11]
MTPQVQTLLNHLKAHGSISQAEAGLIYKIRSLPRRISDLKELGHNITRELKKDATGQRYARYTLVPPPAVPKVGDRVKVVSEGYEAKSRIFDIQYYTKGMTGKVIGTHSDGDYRVAFDNNPNQDNGSLWVSKQDLEVIA